MFQGEGRQGPSFPLQESASRAETPGSQSSHRRTHSTQRNGGVRSPGSQRDGLRTLGSQRDGGSRTPGSQRDGGLRTPGSQRDGGGGRRSPSSQRTVRREDLGRRSSSSHQRQRTEEPPSPTSSWRSRGIPVAASSSLLTSLTSQVSTREQHAALVQASPRPVIKKQKKDNSSCICRLPSVFKVARFQIFDSLIISGGNIHLPVGGWNCLPGGLAFAAGRDRGL